MKNKFNTFSDWILKISTENCSVILKRYLSNGAQALVVPKKTVINNTQEIEQKTLQKTNKRA